MNKVVIHANEVFVHENDSHSLPVSFYCNIKENKAIEESAPCRSSPRECLRGLWVGSSRGVAIFVRKRAPMASACLCTVRTLVAAVRFQKWMWLFLNCHKKFASSKHLWRHRGKCAAAFWDILIVLRWCMAISEMRLSGLYRAEVL